MNIQKTLTSQPVAATAGAASPAAGPALSPERAELQRLCARLLRQPPDEQRFAVDRFRERMQATPLPQLLAYKQAIDQELAALPAAEASPLAAAADPPRELLEQLNIAIVFALDQKSGLLGPGPASGSALPVLEFEDEPVAAGPDW